MDSEIGGLASVAEQTRQVLYGADEAERLADVQLTLDNVARTRTAQLDAQREILRALVRQNDAQTAATQAARESTNAGGAGTQAKLAALDGQKLMLGKTIANLEQAISAAEAQLDRAREEARQADREDPYEDADIDVRVLLLKLYRDMGFTPAYDDEGKLDKILVRSATRDDVHAIPLNTMDSKTQYSPNALWALAE